MGCQKSVTKPNAERSANVRRTLRRLTKAKSTVQDSSVDFAICRVFKGHYELPKSRCAVDVVAIWVGEKNIFSIDHFFEKIFFSTKKNRKIESKKKSSRLFFRELKKYFFKKRFYPDRCACILDGVRAMGIQDWSNGEGEWRRRGLRQGVGGNEREGEAKGIAARERGEAKGIDARGGLYAQATTCLWNHRSVCIYCKKETTC